MKSFEFKEHKGAERKNTIIIDGKKFMLNVTSFNTFTAIDNYNSKRASIYKKAEKAEKAGNRKKTGGAIIDHHKLVVETVDKILGKGSYQRIFENREINFEDDIDVLMYIFDCVTELADKAREEYEHPVN